MSTLSLVDAFNIIVHHAPGIIPDDKRLPTQFQGAAFRIEVMTGGVERLVVDTPGWANTTLATRHNGTVHADQAENDVIKIATALSEPSCR